jgi:hypothetical protein|tara:strand:- start:253 stop:423 length:171 start_codon:yes stop_codon:yes gene_type:complete
MDNQSNQAIRIVINGQVIQEGFESLTEAMEWAKVFVKEDTKDILFENYQKPKLLLD